jgi:rhodanese-related sulfurtransferase
MWRFGGSKHNGRELVAKGALLLDVRTPEEFRDRHLDGAVNIPVQELAGRVSELGAKERPVVVYCRSGARSASAARLMKNAGYEVVDIGGIGNW